MSRSARPQPTSSRRWPGWKGSDRRSGPLATPSTSCSGTGACAGSSTEVTTESLLRGAQASAALAGSVATLDEVRRGAGDPISAGAVRMTAELMSLAPRTDTAPVQVWTRLHQLAAAGLVDDEGQLGHLRTAREPLPDDIPGLPWRLARTRCGSGSAASPGP